MDISKWKNFKISRLFISSTGDTDITQESLSETGIPVISSGESNTGIIGVTSVKAKVFPANTITMDMFGFAFPRGYKYKIVTHARVFSLSVKNHMMTMFECIFLATMLNSLGYKYAYGRMCSWERIKNDDLKLPVQHNNDGTYVIDVDKIYSDKGYIPDWQFMENYIKSLHNEPITTKRANYIPFSLKAEHWEEFFIGNLFELCNGKNKSASDLEGGDDICYIGAKRDDNGVMKHVKIVPENVSDGNCVIFICNGEGSVGYSIYMNKPFIGTSDIVAGYNSELNVKRGLFIATVASLERPRYSFGRKWKKTLSTTTLKLPILHDAKGNPVIDKNKKYSDNGYIPDWDFMERYIDSLPYSDRIM